MTSAKCILVTLAVVVLVDNVHCQGWFDKASNAIGDFANSLGEFASCPSKLAKDCELEKTTDLDKDDQRANCCAWAKYSKCLEASAEIHCPKAPFSTLAKALGEPAGCEGYTFWSPECIYSNYLLYLVGTVTGLVILLVALCVVCYCCCRK